LEKIVLRISKYLQSVRHPQCVENWLISVALVLLCMFQTICFMGNCSWLSVNFLLIQY